MENEFWEIYNAKLYIKQRHLFTSFIVNLVLIAIVWLLTFVPGIIELGSVMTGLSIKMTHVAIIGALGLWGVFSMAFFLAPGIATLRARRGVVE